MSCHASSIRASAWSGVGEPDGPAAPGEDACGWPAPAEPTAPDCPRARPPANMTMARTGARTATRTLGTPPPGTWGPSRGGGGGTAPSTGDGPPTAPGGGGGREVGRRWPGRRGGRCAHGDVWGSRDRGVRLVGGRRIGGFGHGPGQVWAGAETWSAGVKHDGNPLQSGWTRDEVALCMRRGASRMRPVRPSRMQPPGGAGGPHEVAQVVRPASRGWARRHRSWRSAPRRASSRCAGRRRSSRPRTRSPSRGCPSVAAIRRRPRSR